MTTRFDGCEDVHRSSHQNQRDPRASDGASVVVDFASAPSKEGLGSVLLRSVDGCALRAVLVDAQQNPMLMLECAGSRATKVQLEDLLYACSSGQARAQAPEVRQSWFKARSLYAVPYSQGQDVDLFRGKEPLSWSQIAARPTAALSEPARGGFNLYLADPVLADRLAQSIASGSLSVRVAQVSGLLPAATDAGFD